MTMDARKVYNGIVLLTGYLQRLYVFENIHHELNLPHDSERIQKVKELFDDTLAMLPIFEQAKELAPTQVNKLKSVTNEVESLMASYFKDEPVSFQEKLAYVGSSLYAEQHVNLGIIRLGKVFQVEVNRDFEMRTKFYEERTKFIDTIVSLIKKNQQIEDKAMEIIESWYTNVKNNKENILNDLKLINTLIGF
ncbi:MULTISPECIES: transcriptional regulator [Ureibacillus]|uniref:transcriptional regulator n=1 Tax=Ureibacillus TaxID=160795 RepID=UPI000BBC8445|nr:transcriptional regulator [Ureibacillus thermosphaericus]